MARSAWFVFFPHLWCLFTRGHASELVKIYFGAGCFWHVQHEFIQAEKTLLHRSGTSLTALAGYAGATANLNFTTLKDWTACYYDGKVTAEVVGLQIPKDSVADFASVYFGLFVGHDRSHANDRGPHYRAALGLPGGVNSSLLSDVKQAMQAQQKSFRLEAGKGDDPDTLGGNIIWVYDNSEFHFFQAEMSHQFHDDYLSTGKYPESYNQLMPTLACTHKIKPTGCPGDDESALQRIDCSSFQVTPTKETKGGSGGDAMTVMEGTSTSSTTTTSASSEKKTTSSSSSMATDSLKKNTTLSSSSTASASSKERTNPSSSNTTKWTPKAVNSSVRTTALLALYLSSLLLGDNGWFGAP